jgi:hypothetical protein
MHPVTDTIPDVRTCQACYLSPAAPCDLFCGACREKIQAKMRGSRWLGVVVRTSTIIGADLVLALFASFLIGLAPMASLDSSLPPLMLIQLPLLYGMFVAPLIASIAAWRVQPYIAKAGWWGWIRAAYSLIVTLITVVVIVGLRLPLRTMPPIVFATGVAISTWLLGVGIGRWQERYLPRIAQRRAAWRRWTLLGWSIACGMQLCIIAVTPDPLVGLWLGLFVSSCIHDIGAGLLIARFMREAELVQELQQEYRLIWYNV